MRVGLIFLATVMSAADVAHVEGIELVSQGGRAQITIRLDRAVRFTHGRLSNPERLYVDLNDTEAGAAPASLSENAFIKQVRVGRHPLRVTRVVFDLKLSAEHSIVQLAGPSRLLVILGSSLGARETEAAPAIIDKAPPASPPLNPIPATPNSAPVSQKVSEFAEPRPPAPVAPAVPAPRTPIAPGVPSPLTIEPARIKPMAAPAPAEPKRTLTIPRVTQPPKLDDFLSGATHAEAARVSDFRQWEPGDGKPVSRETVAYLSYDDRNVYIIFICRDERGKVRARMSKREDISADDTVAVYLDSFYDHRHAYIFSANPLGIQADGIKTEGEKDLDNRFDTLWHSEGRLTPDGYAVRMAIPFKSLRFSSDSLQRWGIALYRSIVRDNEKSFWPYITKRQANFVPQFAALEGMEQISAGRNIQLIPYGAFTNSKLLNPSLARYQTQNDARAGLDSKVVVRDSLTLDVTINPDFSQVESDDPQVTVNQRYEVQFPEKRPFFIENAGYFSTPINLFFSRRIVDPEFGARLTGKVGRWAIGMLGIDDRAPGKTVDPRSSLYGERAAIGALRIQREFGKDSRIGILATDRDFGSSYDRMFAIDTRLRLSPTWYFTGQAARSYDKSYDRSLNLKRAQGPAYSAELAHTTRHFTYTANYLDFSPDFRAPLGFVRRVDMRQASTYAGYFFQPDKGRILNFGPSLSLGANWDRQGRLQDWYANPTFTMDFKGPIGFTIGRYDAYERYLNRGFRYATNSGSFYASWMKWLIFFGSFQQGAGINYSPAYGLDPFKASSQNASFGFTLRPTPRLRVEESYYFTRLATRKGFDASGGTPTIFNNQLSRTKLNYQFTRALSLRGILDYYALLPNTALINSERYKQLTGDILLTYLLNPGTAMYLGYNDRRENFGIEPEALPGLRRYGPPTYLSGRQIFMKLSYLLRF